MKGEKSRRRRAWQSARRGLPAAAASTRAAGIAVVLTAVLALTLAACGGQPSPGAPATGLPALSAAASASSSAASPAEATPSPSLSRAASPAPGDAATSAALRRLSAYDTAEPLGFRVTGSSEAGGVRIRDISYRGSGATVTGILSLPAGRGPFPAVLYAPGVGCVSSMFEPDISALQRAGIAALAIDPPDGRPPHASPVSLDPAVVAAAHVRYVKDLRRGLDLLASLPRVDPDRLGYVGYSWGGYVGGLLAGLDAPVKYYVLTYAGADWVSADPAQVNGFEDPAAAVAVSRAAAFLFQAGVDDPLFSRASVTRYYDAAPGPKRLQWFPGGHGDLWSLPTGKAIESHRDWLRKNL